MSKLLPPVSKYLRIKFTQMAYKSFINNHCLLNMKQRMSAVVGRNIISKKSPVAINSNVSVCKKNKRCRLNMVIQDGTSWTN